MVCNICIIHKGPFKIEEDFIDIEKKISQLISAGKLENLGKIDKNSPFLKYQYKCLSCNQVWILSCPDWAYRGGWDEEK